MKKLTNAEVRKALQGSIKKWEGVVAGTVEERGGSNCPLCQMFAVNPDRGDCSGCPVFEHTKVKECGRTPFVKYKEAKWGFRMGRGSLESIDAAAQEEVDFLNMLDSKYFGVEAEITESNPKAK